MYDCDEKKEKSTLYDCDKNKRESHYITALRQKRNSEKQFLYSVCFVNALIHSPISRERERKKEERELIILI